ncbi:hypothetical protein PSN45_002712 [Yamadazyma tenuis]|uniref:Alpha/beta-hydrolase n=1 Tax=Candida tenuis (strain ATCC 10573 / BCRC 21748 / CBS 615 / JCM 9827 / NBRC 10315 / NRRL Y-1498 / VKM Y-70) TaxID=590646 RepID=G3AX26_CANTC|nr:alpha/beta-hydrolase [Yamadazyma tenuis ATCC 10573]EGV66673.1 alpha/beta-hydrolase [Yamadazyma tenuis ATCC 10573]WEJ95199.1 hypothetical protein PSN45_002712 [Yamadazyma tenuis]
MSTSSDQNTAFQPPYPLTNAVEANYTYMASLKDWFRQFRLSDEYVESQVLSILPFFPESDGKRVAKIINTPISNNNFIHEFCVDNVESEVSALPDGVKDIVLIHGYAASLGLFFSNFDALSSIPGVRVHAIDLLGFGFSSRPDFPSFKSDTVEDVMKVEDWFIDSIEEWRAKRNITNFVLMGHSFGGYLSSCYALKYNKPQENGKNLINKLVLVSPVGVERNRYSLLKDIPNPFVDDTELNRQNTNTQGPHVEDELLKDQSTLTGHHINPDYKHINMDNSEPETLSRRMKFLIFLWKRNISPFSIVRGLGPFRSKLIGRWTTRRFSDVYAEDADYYQHIHDYFYRTFNGKGSGEYAITRVLDVGAVPKLPLMDRLPMYLTKKKVPTLWLYGDHDWMNVEAGQEIVKEINNIANKDLARFSLIPSAGHHLYLDNPGVFHSVVLKFLKAKLT